MTPDVGEVLVASGEKEAKARELGERITEDYGGEKPVPHFRKIAEKPEPRSPGPGTTRGRAPSEKTFLGHPTNRPGRATRAWKPVPPGLTTTGGLVAPARPRARTRPGADLAEKSGQVGARPGGQHPALQNGAEILRPQVLERVVDDHAPRARPLAQLAPYTAREEQAGRSGSSAG
jgi:hypothetical protein